MPPEKTDILKEKKGVTRKNLHLAQPEVGKRNSNSYS
jgi:hypothetical protein